MLIIVSLLSLVNSELSLHSNTCLKVYCRSLSCFTLAAGRGRLYVGGAANKKADIGKIFYQKQYKRRLVQPSEQRRVSTNGILSDILLVIHCFDFVKWRKNSVI